MSNKTDASDSAAPEHAADLTGVSIEGSGRISTVEELPLEQLRPWPENPRRITAARLAQLKQALADDPEMLAARPLVALPDGTVIAGNQRLRAARELGWRTIPVVIADIAQERARLWALRDNNSYGDWDEPALAELLAELGGGGVELALTGFESAEIDRILDGLDPVADPEQVPPVTPGEAESELGTIYCLGEHRLLCGDARDQGLLARLAQGVQPELLWTDPPYGVSYVGKTPNRLRIPSDDETAGSVLEAALRAADAILAESARFYIASPAGPQGTVFRLAVERLDWRLHQTLVWLKDTPVLGHSDYHYQHEDILYGWKPGPGRAGRGRHKGSRWQGGNSQSSVFAIDRPTRSSEHPTMKPVALVTAQLHNSSRRGDSVLDLFAGSGTTLIACEQLGRRCLAVELDPHYCDVIRHRYRDYTDGH